MLFICLNVQLLFSSPKGAIPPALIDNDVSGIIFLKLTLCTTPKPSQEGHMPLGELNEKVLGSGAAYETPLVGHINLRLKKRVFSVS